MNIVKCLTSINEANQHVKDVEEIDAMWKNDYKKQHSNWKRAYEEQGAKAIEIIDRQNARILELERQLNAQKEFFEVDVKKTKEAKTMFGGF